MSENFRIKSRPKRQDENLFYRLRANKKYFSAYRQRQALQSLSPYFILTGKIADK
jgi:hypothetical protein